MINPAKPSADVFSTYVEVILSLLLPCGLFECFLHVCGGDPKECVLIKNDDLVFSTYMEVILSTN